MTITDIGGKAAGLRQALSTIVVTQSLRYWLLVAWAFGLGICVGPVVSLAWFMGSVLVGLVRGRMERRLAARGEGVSVGAELTAIATLSSVVWSVAPMLAWFSHAANAPVVTTSLLLSGFVLVVTQFRNMPQRVLIVSSPYSVAAVIVAVSAWGQPSFWGIVAAAAAGGTALFTNLLFGRVHRAQIQAFQAEQARLIAEMAEARDRADKANQAKSAFLAIVSHELRTPMNGVLGAAQMLRTTPMTGPQTGFVDMIHDCGDALMSLLNDMLDFAKIEAGRVELEAINVPLRDLVGRVGAIWSTRARAKGLDYEVVIDGAAPEIITGDPTRISQILHNLLSNAVKFTAEGAIRLVVGVDTADTGHARLRLSVTDSGPGIGAEDQLRLFLPFNQLDVSSTREFGGTGLGLAISRRLAELMGGDLDVASTVGAGSTFTFTFEAPVQQWRASPSPSLEAVAAAAPEGGGLRVLVVEDHPVNQRLIQAWLDHENHSVTLADNGQLGLDAASLAAFDLILMDVNMPVMDGLAAVRSLRETDGPNRETPVVMLSASARAEDHEAGFAAGADAYLNKPIDFQALRALLARITQPDLADGDASRVA